MHRLSIANKTASRHHPLGRLHFTREIPSQKERKPFYLILHTSDMCGFPCPPDQPQPNTLPMKRSKHIGALQMFLHHLEFIRATERIAESIDSLHYIQDLGVRLARQGLMDQFQLRPLIQR